MTQDQHKLEPVAHVHSNGDFCADRQITSKDWPVYLYTEAQVNELRAHLQQRPLPVREATDERNWKLSIDGIAGNYGSRWAGPDEVGWSFEQSAFYDFCAALSPSLSVREEPTQDLGNLLARIHRDGGHYIAQHGLAKALEDAEAKVVAWLARDDSEAHTDALYASSPSVQNMGEGETGKDGVGGTLNDQQEKRNGA